MKFISFTRIISNTKQKLYCIDIFFRYIHDYVCIHACVCLKHRNHSLLTYILIYSATAFSLTFPCPSIVENSASICYNILLRRFFLNTASDTLTQRLKRSRYFRRRRRQTSPRQLIRTATEKV